MGISIIITAYNYAHFLPMAVDSALAQDHPDVEVVVIDDGSTDDTPAVMARYGDSVRYIRQENKGLPGARNAGLRQASHEWVILLDADDHLARNAASLAWRALQKVEPDVNLLVFDCFFFKQSTDSFPVVDDGFLNRPLQRIALRDVVLRNRFGIFGLARRSALLEAGGFDAAAGGADDRDMLIKLASRGPVYKLDALLLNYRLHPASMSSNPAKHTRDTATVLARAKQQCGDLLPASDWRLAEAIYHHQVALNWSAAGDTAAAVKHSLLSMSVVPWILDCASIGLPFLGRFRFLLRVGRDWTLSMFGVRLGTPSVPTHG